MMKVKINDIEFTEQEWNFLSKRIIEDALEFHSSVFHDFNEFAPDMVDELYDISQESEFVTHKEVFKKLKELNIKTFGLDE